MPSLAALARRLRVFPIRDLNPTRITPYVTFLLIAANVLVYFAWQPHTTAEADAEFLYQRAAVACEITTRTPITSAALSAGTCTPARSAPVFPGKSIALSIMVSMFLHGSWMHLLGNMLFLSGSIPLDPVSGQLVEGGIKEQTTRVMENIKALLAAAGADFRHVVRTTVFMIDLGEFAAMNDIYASYFAAPYPARSTVQVAKLPRDVRVEIDVIAVLP